MSDDGIDEDDVRHVAGLARIELGDDEVAAFADGFADVLDYFATLDDVEDDVAYEEELDNVMRADEVEEGLSQKEALANAPETEDGYVKGPRVS